MAAVAPAIPRRPVQPATKNPVSSGESERGEVTEESLSYLLRLCSHQILRPLKLALTARGLSVAQYYFLALIAKYNHRSLEQLLALLTNGDSVPSRAEIDDLAQCGLVGDIDRQCHLTDAGAKLHVELVSIYKASEFTALNGLDFAMHQTLKISLLKLIESTKMEK